MAIPVYVVLRNWPAFGIAALLVAATSAVLKKTWWDNLEKA